MRRTSINAYKEAKESGYIRGTQKMVYDILVQVGSMTGKEIEQRIGLPGAWKRCSELKQQGLISESGKRQCRITGKTCITWDVKRDSQQLRLV